LNEFQKSVEKFIPPDLKERYRDFKYVGQGGMGRIISAHDTMLDKRVAIKLLPMMSHSDTALVRFHQEAKAVSKLNHINIVTVLDFGFSATEEPYLVMDYISGTPLDAVIEANHKIPLRNAIQICIQICQGLEHAHFNGVIHRDLKPSNVMLIEDQCVRILDFGLAKIMSQTDVDHRLTRKGQAMGSPLFMSPEQVRGEEADERADVYGLGMLLYKMVTGVVPNEDDNLIMLLRARLEQPPPELPPNTVIPVLNGALNKVIRKALAIDPAERFQSMEDFRLALEALAEVGESEPETELIIPKAPFKIGKIEMAVSAVVAVVVFFVLAYAHPWYQEYQEKKDKPLVAPYIPPTKPKVIVDRPEGAEIKGFEILKDPESPLVYQGKDIGDADLNLLFGTKVRRLSLGFNPRITVNGVKILTEMKLDSLSLRETRIGDETIPYLNELNLEYLDLRGTKVTNAGLAKLKPKTRLRDLNLSYLPHFDNATLKLIVKKFPNLQTITLSNTKVTSHGLLALKPLKLWKLAAAVLNLTDKDMEIIVELNPSALDLEGNRITDKCIPTIAKLKKLEWIGVDYTDISPQGIKQLQQAFPGIKISYMKADKKQVEDLSEILKY
jgi:serine/threonine protein kinase